VAKINHKIYGICNNPKRKEILKNNKVIIMTVIKSKTEITNASLIFLNLKNTGVQIKFNRNCSPNKGAARIFAKLIG